MEVANGVGGASLGTNRRNFRQDLSLLADAIEKVGIGDIRNVVRDLEVTAGAEGFGMDDSFWDPSSREVGQGLDQLRILEEEKASAMLFLHLYTGVAVGNRLPFSQSVEVVRTGNDHVD